MDEQPKALRLADLLEKAPAHTLEDGIITLYLGGTVVADQAAEELRRLHAQNAELLEFVQEARKRGDTRLASMAIAVLARAGGNHD